MKSSKEQLIEIFEEIKNMGWVTSHRSNNTGIGKTFEDLAGVDENNHPGPDYDEFEIKSHREGANSPITLFTLAPSFPKQANRFLKDNYGEYYNGDSGLKKLHTSMFADRKNSYANRYSFQLLNDRKNDVVRIGVFDLHSGALINDSAGYTYKKLEEKLYSKLNSLFYVNAERKFSNGLEEFKFTEAIIYTKPSFERFLNIMDDGKVQYDVRIGSYQSGSKYGMPHDHGSGFRVREDYLLSLYENQEFIL